MVIQQGVPELKLCSSQNHNERGWRLHYTAPKKVQLRRLQQTNGMKISVQKTWEYFVQDGDSQLHLVCFLKTFWRHNGNCQTLLRLRSADSEELRNACTEPKSQPLSCFGINPGGDPVPLGWVDCRLFVRTFEHLVIVFFLSFNLHGFQSFSRQIMAFLLGRGLLGPCLSNIRLEATRTSCCVDFNSVFERFLDCHH